MKTHHHSSPQPLTMKSPVSFHLISGLCINRWLIANLWSRGVDLDDTLSVGASQKMMPIGEESSIDAFSDVNFFWFSFEGVDALSVVTFPGLINRRRWVNCVLFKPSLMFPAMPTSRYAFFFLYFIIFGAPLTATKTTSDDDRALLYPLNRYTHSSHTHPGGFIT